MRPLRIFEKRLLDALGYGLALDRDALSGQPLEAGAAYHYRLEQGAGACGRRRGGRLMYSPARRCCRWRART